MSRLDISTRMHRVLPIARAVLATGIDPFHNPNDIGALYNAAAGGSMPDMPDAVCDAMLPYIDHVFVLGMAVGLLLDTTVLERSGRRTATKPRGERRSTRQRASSRPRSPRKVVRDE